ncbi:MAG: hypothetical protein ACPGN3_13240, partial [Opitutales bacterium]
MSRSRVSQRLKCCGSPETRPSAAAIQPNAYTAASGQARALRSICLPIVDDMGVYRERWMRMPINK